jgi:diguanylate cyclase (GGDEF)-like protein
MWTDSFRHGLTRVSNPRILFPVTAALLITAIWGTTFTLSRIRYADAAETMRASTRELLSTYEAQVVRAVREIEQAINLVQAWPQEQNPQQTLNALADRELLPSHLVFTVIVASRDGDIVASTQALPPTNIAHEHYFRAQLEGDSWFVDSPPRGPTAGQKLHFSRRRSSPEGTFDGVVIVSVDAEYFVSGYEQEILGTRGVLGLLGSDGILRVRRTGETAVSGESFQYPAIVTTSGVDEAPSVQVVTSWDGERRLIAARELYGIPLAVLVGLSMDEQMAGVRSQSRAYVGWAAAGSVLVLLITATLWRLSWQLARTRERENEARVEHAERVEYLAYHDGLTGLPNRALFSKLLGQCISEARRYSHQLAVAFLDLDRFKQINDILGHDAGDQLLQEVARRLKACLRDSDSVARLGGDEFVALMPQLEDPASAAVVARRMLASLAEPIVLMGQECRVTASIGISLYPHDGLDEQTLTKHADIAMYHAKSAGKNNFQFYSEQLNANSLERLTFESNLRLALERDEFRLHYQAKRDIMSGRVTGVEALLRWQHPHLGEIPPLRFIPIAEDTGLIVAIGQWVLRSACRQIVSWQQAGYPPLTVAVNLTKRQFRDEHLLADLTSILASTGMDPHLLEIEISENLLTHDIDNTLATLRRLRTLGVRIAVDDFGTGYSSLAMLQRCPLDTVKIDRSLIRDCEGITGKPLADALIAMGKSLSLTVVAQGVETKEQAEYLRAHACDELQGFYFTKPLPADEFTKLLSDEATQPIRSTAEVHS